MKDFLNQLPVIITEFSKSLLNAIQEFFRAIARYCHKVLRAIWSFYYDVETSILNAIATICLTIWALRYLVAIIAIAPLFAYFSWWLLLAYLALLAAAFVTRKRGPKDGEVEQNLEKNRAAIVSLLRWPHRILISLILLYLSFHFNLYGRLDLLSGLKLDSATSVGKNLPSELERPNGPRHTPKEPVVQVPQPRPVASLNMAQVIDGRVESNVVVAGSVYVTEAFSEEQPNSKTVIERKVLSVENGTMTVSALSLKSQGKKPRVLRFTTDWNLLSSRNTDGTGSDFAPALKYFDFPLSPGREWTYASTETDISNGQKRHHTIKGTVGNWEVVSVPAGKFQGLKVYLETVLEDPASGETTTGTDTSWYVPTVGRSVKSITTSRSINGAEQTQIIQLVSYNLGARP